MLEELGRYWGCIVMLESVLKVGFLFCRSLCRHTQCARESWLTNGFTKFRTSHYSHVSEWNGEDTGQKKYNSANLMKFETRETTSLQNSSDAGVGDVITVLETSLRRYKKTSLFHLSLDGYSLTQSIPNNWLLICSFHFSPFWCDPLQTYKLSPGKNVPSFSICCFGLRFTP